MTKMANGLREAVKHKVFAKIALIGRGITFHGLQEEDKGQKYY